MELEKAWEAIWNIWPQLLKIKATLQVYVHANWWLTQNLTKKKYWHCFDIPHLYFCIRVEMFEIKLLQKYPEVLNCERKHFNIFDQTVLLRLTLKVTVSYRIVPPAGLGRENTLLVKQIR